MLVLCVPNHPKDIVTTNCSGAYYYRYYAQTNAYLGVSADNGHFYYLRPQSGNTLHDLGTVSTWQAKAGCG